MLVLTRKLGDSVQIGDNITATVVAIKGGQVKLGIDAPKSVDILRSNAKRKLQRAGLPERE